MRNPLLSFLLQDGCKLGCKLLTLYIFKTSVYSFHTYIQTKNVKCMSKDRQSLSFEKMSLIHLTSFAGPKEQYDTA